MMKRLAASRRRTGLHFAVAIATLMASNTAAFAQDVNVQIGTSRPPHHVGEPVLVQIIVEGFEEQPDPQCKIENKSPELQARLAGISPSVSESVQIINNQIMRQRSVVYRISYQVTADSPGDYTIGPFLVSQDGKEARTDTIDLSFNPVATDPDMKIKLGLPDRPIYPGERAPMTVEWWYVKDGIKTASNLRIRSPIFDQFTFLDRQATRNDQLLPIQTAEGSVQLVADVREEIADGKSFIVVSAQRTMVADQPGKYEFPPVTASIRKVTRFERDSGFGIFDDVFSNRMRAAETVPMRATGEPLALIVKPFPLEGRPASFAGAIGAGFSLDVSPQDRL